MAQDTRAPTSDLEETGTWSGGSAGSRFAEIDDYADEATNILCELPGVLRLGFSAFSVPAGSTINFVGVWFKVKKAGGGGVGVEVQVRNGTVWNNYPGGPFNFGSATYTDAHFDFTTNPATSSAWTVDEVNGVGTNGLTGFGWDVTDANPDVDIASAQLVVDYTAGSTTFQQTISATAVGVPSISDVITFGVSIPATAVGVPSLSRLNTFARTISAVAVGVPSVATSVTFTKLISAVAVGVPSLTKKMFKTISATAVGQAGLSTAAVIGQTISATAVGVASLATQLVSGVTISAVAVGQAAVSTSATFAKNIAATALGVPVVQTLYIPTQTFFKTISAVAVGVASVTTRLIAGGSGPVSVVRNIVGFIKNKEGWR